MRLIIPVIAVLLAAGCGGNSLPTRASDLAPSAPAPASPAPLPLLPGPPVAALEVVRFTSGPGNDVQLILRETSGQSGATFESPILVLSNGNTDTGCRGRNTIARGGTWSLESMGYCAPVGDGSDGLTVIIHFQDDEGRVGTFAATM